MVISAPPARARSPQHGVLGSSRRRRSGCEGHTHSAVCAVVKEKRTAECERDCMSWKAASHRGQRQVRNGLKSRQRHQITLCDASDRTRQQQLGRLRRTPSAFCVFSFSSAMGLHRQHTAEATDRFASFSGAAAPGARLRRQDALQQQSLVGSPRHGGPLVRSKGAQSSHTQSWGSARRAGQVRSPGQITRDPRVI